MQIFVKDKSFYRKLIIIAVPVILQNVINIGVNMLDTIMLGSFGELQLSASSLANQFISIFHIICLGIGGGAAVLTAQFWGKNDLTSFRKAVTIMYRFVFVNIIVFTMMSLAIPDKIMGLYTTSPEIIDYGVRYLRIMAAGYICLGLSLTTTIVMRSISSVKIPLIMSVVAFLSNLLLNYMFIFGKFGAPCLEIAGAAIATVISRLIEMIVVFGYFLLKEKQIMFRVRHFLSPCRDMVQDYIKYSFPVIISDFLLAIGNTMVTIIIGRIGSSFVSANAITQVVIQISTIFVAGLYGSSSVIIGNTLGEHKSEQAYQEGKTFLIISVLLGLLGSLIIAVISKPVIGFYNIQQETVDIAVHLMQAVSFIIIFQMLEGVMTKGILRGGGDTKFLMAADILFLWVLSVPLGYAAAFIFHLSPFWIYVCLKIDLIVKCVWCFVRFVSRKWIHEVAVEE